MPEKLDDEGNPIEVEDPPEEVPPLRSLADDGEGSWSFRTCPAGIVEAILLPPCDFSLSLLRCSKFRTVTGANTVSRGGP